jgi:DNA-binding NarL/FixJ family response regulator
VRVVVVDDQRIVRDGLVTVVGTLEGVEVVGSAADGAEALEVVARTAPDVVLMDLRMPGVDGVAATGAIRRDHPATRVVVLTTYADDESVLAALSAGASGYLTKDASREDIRRALEAAAAGHAVLDPRAQTTLLAAARAVAPPPRQDPAIGDRQDPEVAASPSGPPPDGLTAREAEVLGPIAAGLSNHEIANRLYVSGATVKTHVNRIFAKTGSRDRAQAVAYAHRHHLVPRS